MGAERLNPFKATTEEDVTLWLRAEEWHMAVLGIKDEPTMCCMVLAALQGDAMRRAMAANLERAADNGGYAGLRAALLEEFQTVSRVQASDRARRALKGIRLAPSATADQVNQFLVEFKTLVANLESPGQAETRAYLLDAVPQEVRRFVVAVNPSPELVECMGRIRTYFEIESEGVRAETGTPMEIGATHQQRPGRRYSRPNNYKRRCWMCGSPEHLMLDCPRNKANYKYSFGPVTGFGSHPMVVNMQTNGQSLNMMVDTGASVTTLSRAARARLKIPRKGYEMIQIGGNAVVRVAKLEKITLRLDAERSFDVQPLELDLGHYDGLLGRDWLNASGMVVDIRNGLLAEGKSHEIASVSNEHADPALQGLLEKTHPDIGLVLKRFSRLCCSDVRKLKEAKVEPQAIHMKEGSLPFAVPIRMAHTDRAVVKSEVSTMLNAGVVRPSRSPYASRVNLVPKDENAWRFCIDYRRLNKDVIMDSYPLPKISDLFDEMGGSKWFSVIDLKSGYWQVPLTEESSRYTAFRTQEGLYEYKRLPFGLSTAPAIFCRVMSEVLSGLKGVAVYIDDILIHTPSWEEHLNAIEQVLLRLDKFGLQYNPAKAQLGRKEVKMLGHIVCAEGLRPDPDTVQSIKEYPAPKCPNDVQRFLGLAGFCRKFIPQYADIAIPMTNLLKGTAVWHWGIEEHSAFEKLKEAISKATTLKLPDVTKPFELHCDASGFALGAVLAQWDDETQTVRPVAFASKKLSEVEVRKHATTMKECLAVVWAVEKFQTYLKGTEFTVYTDHKALKYLLSKQDLNQQLLRWVLKLQEFKFEIEYRKGINHSHADALSRIGAVEGVADNWNLIRALDPFSSQQLLKVIDDRRLPRCGTDKARTYNALLSAYEFREGELYCRTLGKVVPEPERRWAIAARAHRMGHRSVEATLSQLQISRYWWPGMEAMAAKVCRTCEICRQNDSQTVHSAGEAKPIQIKEPFELVGMDLLQLPTTDRGHNYLLVMVDYFTRYPYTCPLKTKETAEVAVGVMNFCSLFGSPKKILSDQGPEFVSSVMDTLLASRYIDHLVSSPYHPQTNGTVERFNRTIIDLLKKLGGDQPRDWDQWLPYAMMLLRWQRHSTTGHSPSELLFGRKAGVFEESVLPKSGESSSTPVEFMTQLKAVRKAAEEQHAKAAVDRKKVQEARNTPENPFAVGQLVRHRLHGQDKLGRTWSTPRRIIRITAENNFVLEGDEERSWPQDQLSLSDSPQTRVLAQREGLLGKEFEVQYADGHSEYQSSEGTSPSLIKRFTNWITSPFRKGSDVRA